MNSEKKNVGLKIFAVIWLLFIFISAVSNFNLFVDSVSVAYQDGLGFKGFIEQVKTAYTSDVKLKTTYINLNGLFARATGRTVYNDVVTLKNGMLALASDKELDTESLAEPISAFNKYLNEKDIKFLYVQAPYKMDLKNELLPTGVEDYSNINADKMVDFLNEDNVNVLDLRTFISSDAGSVEKYYYYTDHHWNSDGAFLAFQKISEEIFKIFEETENYSEFLDKNNWNKEIYENIFLGSLGKRVGQFFAGVDDVVTYKPSLKTDMSLYNNKYLQYKTGDFEAVNIRKEHLEKDYFEKDPYSVYIGGGYPIIKHTNPNASSGLKLLIIKDSYTLPVQAFLSTVFSRIDVIDPRLITAYSISEYVECYKPDIVIQMINPSVFTHNEYFEFGIEECERFASLEPEVVLKQREYEVEAAGKTTYSVFASELSPETKYTFRFKDVGFISSEEKRMTVALYNAETKEIIDSHIFDLELADNIADSKEWTFITPDIGGDDIRLLVYAGEYKKIKDDKLIVYNAELLEYK